MAGHSFTNAAAFVAVGWFVEPRQLPLVWYLVPLAVAVALNLLLVVALVERDRGVRSFIHWQVNGIWLTFIAFSSAAAAVLQVHRAKPGTVWSVDRGHRRHRICHDGRRVLPVLLSGRGGLSGGSRRRDCHAAGLLAPVVSDRDGMVDCVFVPGLILFREKRRRAGREGTRILSASARVATTCRWRYLWLVSSAGPLRAEELGRLLAAPTARLDETLEQLLQRGYVRRQRLAAGRSATKADVRGSVAGSDREPSGSGRSGVCAALPPRAADIAV